MFDLAMYATNSTSPSSMSSYMNDTHSPTINSIKNVNYVRYFPMFQTKKLKENKSVFFYYFSLYILLMFVTGWVSSSIAHLWNKEQEVTMRKVIIQQSRFRDFPKQVIVIKTPEHCI